MEALDKSGEGYILIPRFHPKFRSREELSRKWNHILESAKGYVLYVPKEVTIQQIMKTAGYTVSIYSNALIEAAALGSLPVSWVSEVGRASMRQALGGLERFPLVGSECAVEVETPEEFLKVFDQEPERYETQIRHCKSVYRSDGKNTERVVEAIESEFR